MVSLHRRNCFIFVIQTNVLLILKGTWKRTPDNNAIRGIKLNTAIMWYAALWRSPRKDKSDALSEAFRPSLMPSSGESGQDSVSSECLRFWLDCVKSPSRRLRRMSGWRGVWVVGRLRSLIANYYSNRRIRDHVLRRDSIWRLHIVIPVGGVRRCATVYCAMDWVLIGWDYLLVLGIRLI